MGWRGRLGALSLERGFPAQTSCQGKAGLPIEQSSSCMRADCANSIEHDPSAQPSANKVIFPNLLRQKGDTLPVLVLSTQSRQDQARAASGLNSTCQHLSSLNSESWVLSAAPSSWTELSTGCRNWPLARGQAREGPGILGAWRGAERI